MAATLRLALTIARWVLSLGMAMYLFRGLIVVALSPFGVFASVVAGLGNEALIIALGVLGLAVISAIPISIGVLIAPHRHWKLAIGLLSIALILPMATLRVQDSLISDYGEFDLANLAIWASIAAGAVLVYGVLRWLWSRRVVTPALSTRASVAILSAFALLLLLPIRTVTVPPWRLQFVDARGQPLAGLAVYQSWRDFSVDGQQGGDSEEDTATTDANGMIVFPERVKWASLGLRLWRPVDTDLKSFRHRPEGRLTRIQPQCPLRSREFHSSPMDFPVASLPDRLPLTVDDGPHGGIDPSCQRLLDQARLAESLR